MIKQIIKVLDTFSGQKGPVTNTVFKGLAIFLVGGIGANLAMSFFANIATPVIPNAWLRTSLLNWLLVLLILSIVVFVLFQFFPRLKILQVYPTFAWAYIYGQLSLSLASFWHNWLMVFGIFILCNILYILFILIYQARMIDNVAHEPDELKFDHLYQPMSLLCLLAAGLGGLVRLFNLSNYLMLVMVEMFVIATSIYIVYNFYHIFHKDVSKDKKGN